eukprot:1028608-Alexandrium_andersonii.AAC.1
MTPGLKAKYCSLSAFTAQSGVRVVEVCIGAMSEFGGGQGAIVGIVVPSLSSHLVAVGLSVFPWAL